MRSCCIRTNDGGSQTTIPLVDILNKTRPGGSKSAHSSEEMKLESKNSFTCTLSAKNLNDAIERKLDWPPYHNQSKAKENSNSPSVIPVTIRYSEDAVLLKCTSAQILERERRNANGEDGEVPTKYTIWGIEENQLLFAHNPSTRKSPPLRKSKPADDLKVMIEAYRANVEDAEAGVCHCEFPHYDWTRDKPGRSNDTAGIDSNDNRNNLELDDRADARVKIIDVTTIQKHRRKHCTPSGSYLSLDSPASACHLLRSILKCGSGNSDNSHYGVHCVSPWRECCNRVPMNGHDSDALSSKMGKYIPECDHTDQVIAILMCNKFKETDYSSGEECSYQSRSKINPVGDKYYWDELENRELCEMIKFRTGDVCPNYYLYSSSELRNDFSLDDALISSGDKHSAIKKSMKEKYRKIVGAKNIEKGYTLLVYRHLPKRLHFDSSEVSPFPTASEVRLANGCLWERMRVPVSTRDETKVSNPESVLQEYKMVAAPYQEHDDVFGNLLNECLSGNNLITIAEEASRIPQWTAWPERNHYQSDYDNKADIDGAYPASWTVFPLCHTFPANDVSKRQFIPMTCGFVPQTAKILQSLGPRLRTALFSRLEPRTTLGAHTGWADLANHVLRVHIPLQVPHGIRNDGLCGTWVDGCVESHAAGRIISFDDSKTHRAFNYSDEERVVLIVDLARPEHDFPLGTATGGHTNELDSFIKQFT